VPQGLRSRLLSNVADSEHKLATIGFLKFSGVDTLLSEQGPESAADALDGVISTVQGHAEAEDVTFLASDIDADGGKVIVAAGVPSSMHDDEGRVLRTVRGVLDSAPTLKMRAGVNRGHVFAGDVGSLSRRTFTVMGDTVNLAARLMAAAEPGLIYASPGVLDGSASLFRTEALADFYVKGKAERVRAYSVYEEIGSRPPELHHDLPFHGRDSELEMVVGIVNTCSRVGRGGMMTITGAVGVGKSRLIAEVLERCGGLEVLMVQAEPNGQNNPYWAFRDPLRRLLGVERADQQTMRRELKSAIRKLGPELAAMTPLIGDVTHIEVPDNPETAEIDPKFRPDRAADAIVSLLERAHPGPFAVVAEDGPWLDQASLGLLTRLGDAAKERPWTVLVTARDDADEFDPLGDEITLQPLADAAIRAIAIEATAATPLLPHELHDVVGRADGNPLFLSEMLNVIARTGSAAELPDSLDAVVTTEIDTLPPLSRQLLRYSSVLGRSFRRQVLSEFLEPDEIVADESALADLSRFVDFDMERVQFRHAVVHEIAYSGLPFRRRRELHARAGELIEAQAGPDTDSVAEYLAGHYASAGVYEKAWRYSRVAAERARRGYATTEAAAHYRIAIDAARHLDDAESRHISEMWSRLGEVQDLAGQYQEARDSYRRAIGLTGDPVTSAEMRVRRAEAWYLSGRMSQAKRELTAARRALDSCSPADASATFAKVVAYEASVHAGNGDPVAALRSAEEAVARATAVGDEESQARAYTVLDWANFVMGRDEPRQGVKAVEIYRRLGLVERSVTVLNNLGALSYYEGDWDQAMTWYAESVDAADRSGNVVVAANTRTAMAEVFNGQRRFADALPLAEEAERVIRSSHAVEFLPFVRLQLARAIGGTGRPEEAQGRLQGLLDDQLEAGSSEFTGESAVALAETLVSLGRPGEAILVLDRFAAASLGSAQEANVALLRVRGQALIALGEQDEGRDWLKQSLQAALEDEDSYGELLALEALVQAGEDADGARLEYLSDRLGVQVPQPV
jgi:class 3 adenylate cyclase/tetratricopeptide (TPR) repeat protein